MHDIRKIKYKRNKNYFAFLKKIKTKYVIIFLILLLLLIFPEQIGSFIGNWISDFFGTIIDIVSNG